MQMLNTKVSVNPIKMHFDVFSIFSSFAMLVDAIGDHVMNVYSGSGLGSNVAQL